MSAFSKPPEMPAEQLTAELVFVGFNSRVAALSRATGELIWSWKSTKGSASFVSLLLDGDRLIASVQGYTYCLDPLTGEELWMNPLKGFGYGIPSLVSTRGSSETAAAAAGQLAAQQQQQSANSNPPPLGPIG